MGNGGGTIADAKLINYPFDTKQTLAVFTDKLTIVKYFKDGSIGSSIELSSDVDLKFVDNSVYFPSSGLNFFIGYTKQTTDFTYYGVKIKWSDLSVMSAKSFTLTNKECTMGCGYIDQDIICAMRVKDASNYDDYFMRIAMDTLVIGTSKKIALSPGGDYDITAKRSPDFNFYVSMSDRTADSQKLFKFNETLDLLQYKSINLKEKIHSFEYYSSINDLLVSGEKSIVILDNDLSYKYSMRVNHGSVIFDQTTIHILFGYIVQTVSYQINGNYLFGVFVFNPDLLGINKQAHLRFPPGTLRSFFIIDDMVVITTQTDHGDRLIQTMPKIVDNNLFLNAGYPRMYI